MIKGLGHLSDDQGPELALSCGAEGTRTPDPLDAKEVHHARIDTTDRRDRKQFVGNYANKREAQRAWQDAENKARAGHV